MNKKVHQNSIFKTEKQIHRVKNVLIDVLHNKEKVPITLINIKNFFSQSEKKFKIEELLQLNFELQWKYLRYEDIQADNDIIYQEVSEKVEMDEETIQKLAGIIYSNPKGKSLATPSNLLKDWELHSIWKENHKNRNSTKILTSKISEDQNLRNEKQNDRTDKFEIHSSTTGKFLGYENQNNQYFNLFKEENNIFTYDFYSEAKQNKEFELETRFETLLWNLLALLEENAAKITTALIKEIVADFKQDIQDLKRADVEDSNLNLSTQLKKRKSIEFDSDYEKLEPQLHKMRNNFSYE